VKRILVFASALSVALSAATLSAVSASAATVVVAQDSFTRTAATGWGTADIGGPWTTSSPSGSNVSAGTGVFVLTAGATRRATLASTSAANTVATASVSIDKAASGNGAYAGLVARFVGGDFYQVRTRFMTGGSIAIQALHGDSTLLANATVSGLTYTPGAFLRMRVEVTGSSPTTIRGKVWAGSATEPSSWTVSVTDSTAALQQSGASGVLSYLSSAATNAPVTARYDDLQVTSSTTTPPPANSPPTASFTVSTAGLAVSVNGSGSSDADGSISSYAWNFGDGSTGAGATASHSYAAAGTYTIALTVTDNAGASGATTHAVTVSSATTLQTFGVIGDIPYGSTQLSLFPGRIDQINADPQVSLLSHLGDISAPPNCTTTYYQTIKAQFDRVADPLVYTPGDNEWADCSRATEGAGDPLTRLATVRQVFFPTVGRTLGQSPISVIAQSGYPENVRFTRGDLTFGAIHLVGSNNDLTPWSGQTAPTSAQLAEENARVNADISHLAAVFSDARSTNSRAVILFTQADMFAPGTTPGATYRTAFQSFVRALAADSASFGRPVFLFNGDTHTYANDKPLTLSKWLTYYGITTPVPNLTRYTVEGGTTLNEWLKVTEVSSASVLQVQRVDFT
jgi:PKD repeat protein